MRAYPTATHGSPKILPNDQPLHLLMLGQARSFSGKQINAMMDTTKAKEDLIGPDDFSFVGCCWLCSWLWWLLWLCLMRLLYVGYCDCCCGCCFLSPTIINSQIHPARDSQFTGGPLVLKKSTTDTTRGEHLSLKIGYQL